MVSRVLVVAVVLMSLAQLSAGRRRLMELYIPPASDQLTYHHGTVLSGDIPVSVLWYGKFTPAQRSIVSDFLLSLTVPAALSSCFRARPQRQCESDCRTPCSPPATLRGRMG